MFSPVIHFELTFVKSIRSVSGFYFFLLCHLNVHLFQHHLLKRLSLLSCIAFAPLSKVSWLYLCGSISGLPILSRWHICLFFHQYHTVLITVDLEKFLKSGTVNPSTLFLSFSMQSPKSQASKTKMMDGETVFENLSINIQLLKPT